MGYKYALLNYGDSVLDTDEVWYKYRSWVKIKNAPGWKEGQKYYANSNPVRRKISEAEEFCQQPIAQVKTPATPSYDVEIPHNIRYCNNCEKECDYREKNSICVCGESE